MAVNAYLLSKHLLPLSFAEQYSSYVYLGGYNISPYITTEVFLQISFSLISKLLPQFKKNADFVK